MIWNKSEKMSNDYISLIINQKSNIIKQNLDGTFIIKYQMEFEACHKAGAPCLAYYRKSLWNTI